MRAVPRCLLIAALLAPWLPGDAAGQAVPAASDAAAPASSAAAQAPPAEAPGADTRDPFQASAYVGLAFDNFAPASIGGYQSSTTGGSSKSRFVGGVDFEMRAWGAAGHDRQLWIVGETLHGVRSADVDCSSDNASRPPVCDTLSADPGGATKKLLYTFEHATSFEAYLSPRLELLTLQRGSSFPSKLYVTMRFGVLMLTDNGSKAFDAHHLGLGLRSPAGPFGGSYLELGWGRSDLFFAPAGRNPWHRLKIDGSLSFPALAAISDKMPRVFVQLYSDFDPRGDSADSIQTFVGLDFDIDQLFRF